MDVVVVVVGVVSIGIGTGVIVAAVSVAHIPKARARSTYSGPMFLSSLSVAMGVISSSGGRSAPRWRKITSSIQKKMMGELLEKNDTAWTYKRGARDNERRKRRDETRLDYMIQEDVM